MKVKFGIKNAIYLVAVLGLFSVTFTSCSDDDDNNTPKELTVSDVNGSYTGQLLIAETRATEKPGISIAAKAEKDTIAIDKFPVDSILIDLYGKEKADEFLKTLGSVTYKVGYSAKLNTAKDSVLLTLNPKELEFVVKGPEVTPQAEGGEGEDQYVATIKVTVESQGLSAYSSAKKLKFGLKAKEAKIFIDGKEEPKPENVEEAQKMFNYNFDLTKK